MAPHRQSCSPADATVDKLVGYENVLRVEIDRSAQILIDGVPSGVEATTELGPATLATWGTAIRVIPPDAAPLHATVECVSQGAGRWDVTLSVSQALHAHPRLDQPPPRVSERVGLHVDSVHAAVIAKIPRVEDPPRYPSREWRLSGGAEAKPSTGFHHAGTNSGDCSGARAAAACGNGNRSAKPSSDLVAPIGLKSHADWIFRGSDEIDALLCAVVALALASWLTT